MGRKGIMLGIFQDQSACISLGSPVLPAPGNNVDLGLRVLQFLSRMEWVVIKQCYLQIALSKTIGGNPPKSHPSGASLPQTLDPPSHSGVRILSLPFRTQTQSWPSTRLDFYLQGRFQRQVPFCQKEQLSKGQVRHCSFLWEI